MGVYNSNIQNSRVLLSTKLPPHFKVEGHHWTEIQNLSYFDSLPFLFAHSFCLRLGEKKEIRGHTFWEKKKSKRSPFTGPVIPIKELLSSPLRFIPLLLVSFLLLFACFIKHISSLHHLSLFYSQLHPKSCVPSFMLPTYFATWKGVEWHSSLWKDSFSFCIQS